MAKKTDTRSKTTKRRPAAKKSAKSKGTGKPKGSKKTKKKAPQKTSGFFFEICLVVMAGLLAGVVLFVAQQRYFTKKTHVKPVHPVVRPLYPARVKPAPKTELKPKPAPKPVAIPAYEIYPPEPIPPPPPKPVVKKGKPRVAIIIDDIGYKKGLAEKFMHLDVVFAYSILPDSPFHRELAGMAHKMGYPVMLHLPMEPMEYPTINPGPGALLCEMTPDQRIRMLRKDLAAVPYISGVNNHMGSRMTANSDDMNQILSILKLQGLFFIDSRTTAASVVRSSARLFHVPFAQRDVFLDNVLTSAAIEKQIRELVRIAEKNGEAIGIGHPHEETYEAIRKALPEIREKVRLVPVSDLVSVIGS